MVKVSIITVSFNSNRTIEETILSVINQSYKNVEYIIIDGQSTDGTIDTIKKYKFFCKSISEPDNGIYDAMNKGIRVATGDIVGILNSDDLYYDNHVLERVIDIFEKTKVECVHADLYYVNKDNKDQIVRHWQTCDYSPGAFKCGWHPAHPTFFVKRDVYKKYGLFNLDFNLAADFELMLRLLERHKISSTYLPIPIVRMRLGGATSKNIRNIIKQNLECYKAFKVNGIKVSPFYSFSRLLPKLKQFWHE